MKKKLSNNLSEIRGVVFNTQKYSVHDGPGIRTVVFLKGCSLSCKWCSNPESQDFSIQLTYSRNKCISTGRCLLCGEVCSSNALSIDRDQKINVNWATCTNCLACTEVCPSSALVTCGEELSVNEIIDSVEQDAVFYARSGGGLTLGGGEPLAQPDFAIALLKEAKKRYIKTAIETCGHVSHRSLLEAAKYCNIILYDIKSMDSEKHRQQTGQGNSNILDNFRLLVETYPALKIRVRTPIIPGFNDTTEDIQNIVDWIKPYEVEHELLPYHRLGTQKYENLGKPYEFEDISLDNNRFFQLQSIAKATNNPA